MRMKLSYLLLKIMPLANKFAEYFYIFCNSIIQPYPSEVQLKLDQYYTQNICD